MKSSRLQLILVLFALAAAATSPNLFVAAQAGYDKLSHLAVVFLIPSIILLAIVIIIAIVRGCKNLNRQIAIGLLGGILATLGLEVVREIGFRLGGMPGEMPQLMGVLMLDRFAMGPNWLSNLVGWAYHFWNGASFGLIYSLLLGRPPVWSGVVFGILIGVGLMLSPVVVAMGVGIFGSQFGIGFPVTVILAHIAFGLILGNFVAGKNRNAESLWTRLKSVL
ncbi:MAG: hypothetical protein GWP06_00020 [Actinobacteria bacterium]|nr:hypothetical protein [Actinomycetota bacterium]